MNSSYFGKPYSTLMVTVEIWNLYLGAFVLWRSSTPKLTHETSSSAKFRFFYFEYRIHFNLNGTCAR